MQNFDGEEKTASRLARQIARDVAERGLEPGSVLSPEHAMATEFGVGRATIREALRILESQGIVVMRRGIGGGPVVAKPDAAHLGRTITLFLQMHQTRFGDTLGTWVALEGSVAADAARNFPKAKEVFRRRLARFLDSPATPSADDDRWMDDSAGFHELVRDIADNSMMRLLADAVSAIVLDRVHFNSHEPFGSGERARVHREHHAIATAVTASDIGTARALMEQHLERTGRSLCRRYPGLADQIIDWH